VFRKFLGALGEILLRTTMLGERVLFWVPKADRGLETGPVVYARRMILREDFWIGNGHRGFFLWEGT